MPTPEVSWSRSASRRAASERSRATASRRPARPGRPAGAAGASGSAEAGSSRPARDLDDLRVNRLEVQQLVGGVDPPGMGEHGGQRLAGHGGQLDGPGAQPQPLGSVLRRRQGVDPGPDGVELGGWVVAGRGQGRRRIGVRRGQIAELGQGGGPLGQQPRPLPGRAPGSPSARSHSLSSVAATVWWPMPRTTSAASGTRSGCLPCSAASAAATACGRLAPNWPARYSAVASSISSRASSASLVPAASAAASAVTRYRAASWKARAEGPRRRRRRPSQRPAAAPPVRSRPEQVCRDLPPRSEAWRASGSRAAAARPCSMMRRSSLRPA